LGLNKRNEASIYALSRIKAMGESWTTFSLVQGFSYEKFIQKVFDIDKVL